MKKKLIISLSLSWLLIVGYLTWYNGLKSSGRYKGFKEALGAGRQWRRRSWLIIAIAYRFCHAILVVVTC